jgi:hypothetical protein
VVEGAGWHGISEAIKEEVNFIVTNLALLADNVSAFCNGATPRSNES